MEVSAHFFIRRSGELIQFVPCERRAWHAGRSQWKGRERCNDFSIGIELEGTDDAAFSGSQYVAARAAHAASCSGRIRYGTSWDIAISLRGARPILGLGSTGGGIGR